MRGHCIPFTITSSILATLRVAADGWSEMRDVTMNRESRSVRYGTVRVLMDVGFWILDSSFMESSSSFRRMYPMPSVFTRIVN